MQECPPCPSVYRLGRSVCANARLLLAMTALAGMSVTLAAAPPDKSKPPSKTKPTAKPTAPTAKAPAEAKTAPSKLDVLKTPPGAIVVICNQAADAFGLVPRGVLLAPDAYQKLLDQIDQLRRKLQTTVRTPAVCTLSGRMEKGVAQVEAEFEFTTQQPNERVALGCQKTSVRSARIDGHLPMLTSSDDGLVVQVEKPGTHQLTLSVETAGLPRGTKEGERGLDFSLPRAAITKLRRFDVPADVSEVVVNGRTVRTKGGRIGDVLLGAADRLEMSWKARTPAAAQDQKEPLTAAEAFVVVHVDDSQVSTETKLTLKVLRGKVGRWQIRVPLETRAELKDRDEHTRLILPTGPSDPILTVERDPSADPLILRLYSWQPRKDKAITPGPWYVLGAVRQQGTISITAAPDVRVQFHPHDDVLTQAIADPKQPDAIAAFSYWALPAPPAAPLVLEVGPLKGWLETRTSHLLRLEPGSGWRLTTRIDAVPVRTGVDHLDIRLPDKLQCNDTPDMAPSTALLESPPKVEVKNGHKTMSVHLVSRQRDPFSITLTGLYPLPPYDERSTLALPIALATQDHGGQLRIELPSGLELVGPMNGAEPLPPGTREQTWRMDRSPERAVLAWRPYRPELAAALEADVTLTADRAWVREQVHFPASNQIPPSLFLIVPPALRGHVDLKLGNRPGNIGPDGRVQAFDATVTNWLTMTYSWALPALAKDGSGRPARQFTIPLVRLRDASQLTAHVYFYPETGAHLQSVGRGWEEERLEPTAEASLPALIVRNHNLEVPLTIREQATEDRPLAGLFIERSLFQVGVDGSGGQVYRARFVAARSAVRQLSIDLPAPVSTLNARVFVQGKEVTAFLPSGDDRRLSFALAPGLVNKPFAIEVRYQLAADSGIEKLLRTTLRPPRFATPVIMGQTRWQVCFPAGWVTVSESGYGSELTWDWHGVFWVPRPSATTEDLEQWLAAPAHPSDQSGLPDLHHEGVVCWGGAQEHLTVIHVPQTAWLLGCSAVFLGFGLALLCIPWPRVVLGVLIVAAGGTAVAATLLSSRVLPAVVYGCEPGCVVLLVLLAVQGLLQRRYRRQVTLASVFSRVKAGSSLVRLNRPAILHGEPSTVDVPPVAGMPEARSEHRASLESSKK